MCGISGAIIRNTASDVYYDLLRESDIRGQDGTGICISREGLLLTTHWECRAKAVRDFPELFEGDIIIGQNRLAVFGTGHENDQPILSDNTALVHNGNLYDFEAAFASQPDLERKLSVDSELILRMFDRRFEEYVRVTPEEFYAADNASAALQDVFEHPSLKGNAACLILQRGMPFITAASFDKPLLAMSYEHNTYFFSTDRIARKVFGNAVVEQHAIQLALNEIKTVHVERT